MTREKLSSKAMAFSALTGFALGATLEATVSSGGSNFVVDSAQNLAEAAAYTFLTYKISRSLGEFSEAVENSVAGAISYLVGMGLMSNIQSYF